MPMPTDKIILKSIRFYGYHGVSDEEQTTGRTYEVDVELPYDLHEAGETDRLEHTVNYRQLFDIVIHWGTQKRFRLLESLAHHIAQDILEHTNAREVCIRVRKIHPPLPSVMEYASVEITRKRTA